MNKHIFVIFGFIFGGLMLQENPCLAQDTIVARSETADREYRLKVVATSTDHGPNLYFRLCPLIARFSNESMFLGNCMLKYIPISTIEFNIEYDGLFLRSSTIESPPPFSMEATGSYQIVTKEQGITEPIEVGRKDGVMQILNYKVPRRKQLGVIFGWNYLKYYTNGYSNSNRYSSGNNYIQQFQSVNALIGLSYTSQMHMNAVGLEGTKNYYLNRYGRVYAQLIQMVSLNPSYVKDSVFTSFNKVKHGLKIGLEFHYGFRNRFALNCGLHGGVMPGIKQLENRSITRIDLGFTYSIKTLRINVRKL
jgi:hypothetical protein